MAEAGPPVAEEFLRDHLAQLVRYAHALCGSAPDAEDLVAAAVLAALPRWSAITGSPMAYLRKAIAHRHIDGIRSIDRHRRLDPPTRNVPQPDTTDRVAERLALAGALEALSPVQRTVVVLRYFEDLPVADVATLLDRPPGTVRRITHEALTVLRAQNLFADPAAEGDPS